MRVLRLVGVFVRVMVMNEMQYRANFFFQLLQSLAALAIGLTVLALVFGFVDELGGWTRAQLVAVLGTFTIMGGLVRMVVRPNLIQFMQDVQEGTLDYVLIKPADSQLLVSIRMVHLWHGVDVVIGAVLLVVAAGQLGSGLSVPPVLAFMACLLLGTLMIYSFMIILVTVAFRFVYVSPIIELFEGMWQAGRWPITIYPGWLRVGLTVVVPIGVAITVPAEALTGRLSAPVTLGFVALAAVLLLAARLVWRAGIRRYSGASA